MASDEICYGYHAVKAALERTPERVKCLYVALGRKDQRTRALLELAVMHKITVETLPLQSLDSLAPESRHQGFVLVRLKKETPFEHLDDLLDSLTEPAFLLLLDGIQDPHNLGACLRSANAAGIHAVIIPKDRAVGVTPVVHKVASGAVEETPLFVVTNLSRTMEHLKSRNIWLYGASEHAETSYFDTDLTGSLGLVFGAEEKGLRRLTQEHCDGLLRIPMFGSVSSLNVSVATGVVLFEAVRQRSFPSITSSSGRLK